MFPLFLFLYAHKPYIMKYLSTIFIILFSINFINAQCVDENNVINYNIGDDAYEIVKENVNWETAAACAAERGGYLAEINSQEENDSLFNFIIANVFPNATIAPDGGGGSYIWIGGNDIAEEGVWIWDGDNNGIGNQFWQGTTSGYAVNDLYNNWGNEPDNFSQQHGLGLALSDWPLGVASQWNDVDIGNNLFYVIEYSDTSTVEPMDTTMTTSINESSSDRINVFPNPAKEVLNISFNSNVIDQVEVFNINGQVQYFNTSLNARNKINIANWEAGVYFVLINNEKPLRFVKE